VERHEHGGEGETSTVGEIRMIAVADFMTQELVTVKETDDLALAESMFKLGGIRHLPVVEEGKLIGIVTHRDLLRSHQNSAASTRTLLVSDIMTRDPTTVRPTTSLVSAARLMLENKFGCLPVCEADGTLVGIITESDFVRFAADMVSDLDLVAEAVKPGHEA
jgi:CBS domain-containing protein